MSLYGVLDTATIRKKSLQAPTQASRVDRKRQCWVKWCAEESKPRKHVKNESHLFNGGRKSRKAESKPPCAGNQTGAQNGGVLWSVTESAARSWRRLELGSSRSRPRAASRGALGFTSATSSWARLRGSQTQETYLWVRKCSSIPEPLGRLPLSTFHSAPFKSRPPSLPDHPSPQDSLRGFDFDRHCVIFPGAGPSPLRPSRATHQRHLRRPIRHFRSTSAARPG